MANAVKTMAINAAFLQEIKEDNVELHRRFEVCQDLLNAEEAAPSQTKSITDALVSLRDQIAMHFALEESFGYVDDAIASDPRLNQQAEVLRAEHESLYLQVCEVVEFAERLLYHEVTTNTASNGKEKLSQQFDQFQTAFQHHEDQESELILAALDDDIGVGD